jgi:hypothetical protein
LLELLGNTEMAAAPGATPRARLRFNQAPFQIAAITGKAGRQNQQKVERDQKETGSAAVTYVNRRCRAIKAKLCRYRQTARTAVSLPQLFGAADYGSPGDAVIVSPARAGLRPEITARNS